MKIVSRSEWKALPPKWNFTLMSNGDVEDIYLHWNGTPIHTWGGVMARAIQRYHRRLAKNNDVLYSYMIDSKGTIFEGRGLSARDGATSPLVAGKSYSIFMGVGTGQKIPIELLKATKDLVQAIKPSWNTKVSGHREAPGAKTSCPGPEILAWIHAGMPVMQDKPKPVKPKDLVAKPLPALGSAILQEGDWRNNLPWRKIRVNAMQRALGQLGYGLVGTGPWGPRTTRALVKFQADNNLRADGRVGPETWAILQDRMSGLARLQAAWAK